MKISFYGDICLYKIDIKQFQFCPSLIKLLKLSDINIGNLECPITNVDTKEENLVVNMSAPLSSLELINKFQIVSLANNHIRDFKIKGLRDTINALNSKNIKYFGVGKTQKQAIEPLKITKNGFKIAFLGATRYANATKKNGGGTAKDSFLLIKKHIKRLKKEGYFIILYFHWGYEYVRIPSPRERKLAHKCIDVGADLIVGSHPHIYQGIEDYRGKKIVYSLGNFIFHSSIFTGLSLIPNDPRLNESYTFTIEILNDLSYKIEINGYKTEDTGITFYNETENLKLINEINKHSKIFTDNYWNYLKAYYSQTYDISKRNIKVREDFQSFKKLSLKQKINIYKTANLQDLKNRLYALFITYKRK
ncbi:MAG TPA: CapA family protein [Salinivirgaceae bacterium]|nr:CapA family protein [Salinivirgaceae bacterium]HQA75501.1 CapA family protein [Salinivirgaceae bacterium]